VWRGGPVPGPVPVGGGVGVVAGEGAGPLRGGMTGTSARPRSSQPGR
jgi:hypothetical protein